MKQYDMPRKTIYGKCPKCKTKSQLEVLSGKPGQEKFKCNMCYHTFVMDDLWTEEFSGSHYYRFNIEIKGYQDPYGKAEQYFVNNVISCLLK